MPKAGRHPRGRKAELARFAQHLNKCMDSSRSTGEECPQSQVAMQSDLLLIDVSDRVDSIITMMKALSTAMTRRMVGQELEIRISKHID